MAQCDSQESPGDDRPDTSTRYFVMKCDQLTRLQVAKDTSVWACADRLNSPQPKDILREAFTQGRVLLIFSASNCHGWHGLATMDSPPGCLDLNSIENNKDGKYETETMCAEPESSNSRLGSESRSIDTKWHKFRIKWDALYLWEHGEQCLSYSRTEKFLLDDGTKLNNSRNMQELPAKTGAMLCEEIRKHYKDLCELKKKKEEEKLKKLGDPFFDPGLETNQEKIWQMLIEKVQSMGTVLLACVFGSQRYNLHTPDSDVDMFIVYSAPSTALLGFGSPQHTIKNRDTEACDYTIHEARRYCELLLSGDHRCVETLFLHPSSIHLQTDRWRCLLEFRDGFLTRSCIDKYLSDATGNKGTKLLEKWSKSGVAMETPMPGKVAKLFYIILRLLQNARQVAVGMLAPYRAEGSVERVLLLRVRRGDCDYASLRENVDSLLDEVRSARAKMETRTPEGELHAMVENWLVSMRIDDLRTRIKTEL